MTIAMDRAVLEAVKRPTRPMVVNWLLYRMFGRDRKTMHDFRAGVLKTRRAKDDMLYAKLYFKD